MQIVTSHIFYLTITHLHKQTICWVLNKSQLKCRPFLVHLTEIYFAGRSSLTRFFCAQIIADLSLLLHTAVLWEINNRQKVNTQVMTWLIDNMCWCMDASTGDISFWRFTVSHFPRPPPSNSFNPHPNLMRWDTKRLQVTDNGGWWKHYISVMCWACLCMFSPCLGDISSVTVASCNSRKLSRRL